MILVEIQNSRLVDMRDEEQEMYLIAVLKDAGIPIKGSLKFRGCEHGTLTKDIDFDTMTTRFKWVDR
jgi:hypothetical protein